MESTEDTQNIDPGGLGNRDFIYGAFAPYRMPARGHPRWLVHRASGMDDAGKLAVVRARQGRGETVQKVAMAPTQPVAGPISLPGSKIPPAQLTAPQKRKNQMLKFMAWASAITVVAGFLLMIFDYN